MTEIKFGTDGWRALIGKGFVPENIIRVISGFCAFQKDSENKLVYVGYDRREKSDVSAKLVAHVLADAGFEVRLSKHFCPTPCISWIVKEKKALAGIIVTASHNPSGWNGLKFKESYGGSASPEYTAKIEKRIVELKNNLPQLNPYGELVDQGKIQPFDPEETYVRHLRNFVDVEAIRGANFQIGVDPLFGAGTGFTQKVLETKVFEIHAEPDPKFGGLTPEPIEKNLQDLRDLVLKNKLDIGLATDGDADRIGVIDGSGEFVNSHQIFALLLKHHVQHRKLQGKIVKSISTTQWINKICEAYGLELIETPIGFKHISRVLKESNALMGGEESGGISLREHVHERDGILNGLFLLEMMAVHKKSMSGLLEDIYKEFGRFYFLRDDYHLTSEKISQVKAKIFRHDFSEVDGIKVKDYSTVDGTKILFQDDSWILVRASGTEPLLRVYAEAHTKERVKTLLDFVKCHLTLGAA